jgi:hypothetical protein
MIGNWPPDVLDPQTSGWINVAPGMGKTHVLISRVVRLILAEVDPAKIMWVAPCGAVADQIRMEINRRVGQWSSLDDSTLDMEIGSIGIVPDQKSRAVARHISQKAIDRLTIVAPNRDLFVKDQPIVFDHLIVDEAGRLTAQQQTAIINKFAPRGVEGGDTKRSVFVVGDAWQSIFSTLPARHFDRATLRLVRISLQRQRQGRTDDVNGRSLPPGMAEWLIALLAPRRKAESILGDFEERYFRDCQRRGRPRAVSLYWARTLASILPLAWSLFRKVGVIALCADAVRRWLH